MLGLSLLSVLQGRADPRLAVVLPGGLDQQPASETGPCLGDLALV